MSPRKLTMGAVAALGLSLAFAGPALAQSTMDASKLSICSATITDHCINRGESQRIGAHKVVRHRATAHRVKKHRRHHGTHRVARPVVRKM
ncbi:MAG: hypothetical protein B7Z36_04465 [Novosphingobium sp. 12-63-9]|nr:MAG: hypothetical protein B7Z36_04465 [Novosphingobium sp. 12-63-9]